MAARGGIAGVIQALVGFLALGGGALGGFHLFDNASEVAPATVARAVSSAVKSAAGSSAGASPIAAVGQALKSAGAAAGVLPPVEESQADWVRPAAADTADDHGATAKATSSYGSATCECSCEENESVGQKVMRWLPFLGFLPGIGP